MHCNKKLTGSSFLVLLLLMTGCGYSPRPLLGSGLRTIAIDNLENKTYEHSLEVLIAQAVRNEFIFDGTLKVVEKTRADLLLSGAVIDYIFEPLSYDNKDKAESYRLRIRTKLTLKNLKTGEVVWQDKIVEGDARYLLTGSLAETEAQARDKALEDLAKEILRQAIDIW